MPLHEVTTCATSHIPEMAARDGNGSPTAPWDDPHPGQRVMLSQPAPGTCGHPQTMRGSDFVGGVAAKEEAALEQPVSEPVRRSPPTWHRNTMPRPLTIPAQVPEEPESKSAPVIRSRRLSFGEPVDPVSAGAPQVPQQASEIDTDTETEIGAFLDEMDPEDPKGAELSPCFLSDFSNHLGISPGQEDDDVSVTVVGSASYSRMSSSEDLYGWEAELEKKAQCGMDDPECFCRCEPLHYERADGGKRSLLHRVFSIPSARRTGPGA